MQTGSKVHNTSIKRNNSNFKRVILLKRENYLSSILFKDQSEQVALTDFVTHTHTHASHGKIISSNELCHLPLAISKAWLDTRHIK